MIDIDGSIGEGGGQILRTALGLSMVTGRPFRITDIRANREKPGLMRQHLTAVQAAQRLSSAEVEGATLGSRQLTFTPGPVAPGDYTFSIGTAGSTTLVLQAILPALLCASGPSTITLEGGTDNPHAPPFEFLDKAFLPLVQRTGPAVHASIERHGFYPAGGGRWFVSVTPAPDGKLTPLQLRNRGAIQRRQCTAWIAALPDDIAERELAVVQQAFDWPAESFQVRRLPTDQGPGNLLTIELTCGHVTELFTGFGQRGVRAEAVAGDALQQTRRYLASGVPIGPCLADQLLIPLALAGGGSFLTQTLTRHARTNMDVIAKFLPVQTRVQPQGSDQVLVEVVPA